MTDVQEQVGVLVTYAAEGSFGVAPSASGTSQRLRRTTTGMNLEKDTFASQEVRPDQQIAVFRHGGQNPGGQINGELSTVTYDDFLEALLRGTWATGAALSNSDLGSATISSGVCTFGSGNPLSLGLKVGDIIRFANMSVAGNNAINLRITAVTSTTITLVKTDGTAPADNASDSAYTLTVPGKKLLMGTTKRSFTVEQSYPDIDGCEVFSGCRVGGASIQVPPNGILAINFQLMARKAEALDVSDAPYFTNATAAGTTDVLTGIEGGLRVAGVEQGVITGFDMTISGNMSGQGVVGTPYKPNIFGGRLSVTGNLSFFLQDMALLRAFYNEQTIDFTALLEASGNDPKEFLAVNMQAVKLGGASKTIAAEGGVIVQAPYQALLKAGGAGTAYDQSTLVFQRSNS